MKMNFTNKAGMLLVAAGISFGAAAMDGQQQLTGQWEEQVGQRECPEVPFEYYCREKCSDLGTTVTVVKEFINQIQVTTTVEKRVQRDTERLERKRDETDFPRVKRDPCIGREQAGQCDQMVLKDVCQSEQQQEASSRREGSSATCPSTEEYPLFLANEEVREYFDSETETVVTVTKQLFEKTWNEREVSEQAGKDGCWHDKACQKSCGKSHK